MTRLFGRGAALPTLTALVASLLMSTAIARAEATEAPATQPARPYAVAHDAPLNAKETFDGKETNHRRYRVEFDGIEGDRVPAYLYVPTDARQRQRQAKRDGRRPAVLLQYGSGGNKNTGYIVELGERFAADGFVVLTIDVPDRGERRAKDPSKRGWRRLLMGNGGTILQTLGDYSRAVDYLESRKDVDRGRIGYSGISLGAITGITFSAHDERIRAVASIVGGGNVLGSLKVELDPAVKAIAERIDPVYHVALIAPRPLLLLNATHDQLIPRFFAESLHKAAGDQAKKLWVDTDHFFRGANHVEVLDTVIGFMAESLAASERDGRSAASRQRAAARRAG